MKDNSYSSLTNDTRAKHDNKNGPCKCGAWHKPADFKELPLKPGEIYILAEPEYIGKFTPREELTPVPNPQRESKVRPERVQLTWDEIREIERNNKGNKDVRRLIRHIRFKAHLEQLHNDGKRYEAATLSVKDTLKDEKLTQEIIRSTLK